MERISVFDMFKIGVGPSSSHTLGPWKAALAFIEHLREANKLDEVSNIQILLYGSLAKTGKGHGTDVAVILGLCGANPETFDVTLIDSSINEIRLKKVLPFAVDFPISFNLDRDLIFLMNESLPFHPNALTFLACFANGDKTAKTYYSVGGGFVVEEGQNLADTPQADFPFPIDKADDLLHWCIKTGLPISEIILENENALRPEEQTRSGLLRIWEVMKDCMYRGSHLYGELPGGLHVNRRAAILNKKLIGNKSYQGFEEWMLQIQQQERSFSYTLDALSCFALAVNEENASFSRVVTAPTNGAAGVIPAVLMYYVTFCDGYTEQNIIDFLLCASEIGSLYKKGATISAAMGGCQAEIGVSSSMAAAALAQQLGGSVQQCLMAAEIAMEHHLGMTCDPIGGLVQIPCIERNTMGAIKAITAAQLALNSNPNKAIVSLDDVVHTMWATALDMNQKYKETAEGGLALRIPLGMKEC